MKKVTHGVMNFDQWKVGDGREPQRRIPFPFSLPRTYQSMFSSYRVSEDILHGHAGMATVSADCPSIIFALLPIFLSLSSLFVLTFSALGFHLLNRILTLLLGLHSMISSSMIFSFSNGTTAF